MKLLLAVLVMILISVTYYRDKEIYNERATWNNSIQAYKWEKLVKQAQKAYHNAGVYLSYSESEKQLIKDVEENKAWYFK